MSHNIHYNDNFDSTYVSAINRIIKMDFSMFEMIVHSYGYTLYNNIICIF